MWTGLLSTTTTCPDNTDSACSEYPAVGIRPLGISVLQHLFLPPPVFFGNPDQSRKCLGAGLTAGKWQWI